MKRLDRIKEEFNKGFISDDDAKWLISRVDHLESSIGFYLKNIMSILTQKNPNGSHFVLIERMKKALDDQGEA